MIADAQQAVQAIYHAMRAHTEAGQLPDGTQVLELPNGRVFRIFNDPSEDAPNGISWYLDSPDGSSAESGGWESLALPDPALSEIIKLAGYLDGAAAVSYT